MSRIHEALRRAEGEREKVAPGELSMQVPESFEPEPAGTATPLAGAAAVAAAGIMASLDPPAVNPQGSFEHESDFSGKLLAARCSKCDWKPDSKHVLLAGSNGAGTGLEELRTLRSRLYQIRQKQPLQSILITSALPEEGKSYLAASLAQIIIKQRGRRVLLIDADLRRSQLHLTMGAPQAPGLTEYLAGGVDESTVIQGGSIDNFFFIPGGKTASNPSELIASGRFRTLLQRVKSAFDWIIVDSPPIVPVSDGSMLADFCDGVLMVVLSAVTPLELVQKAQQEFHNKRLLGIVLNRAERRAPYGAYYYYKQYPDGENN